MKRVNLIVIFSVTVVILAGISLLSYGDSGFYLSGFVTEDPINNCNPIYDSCSDGEGELSPGVCSESKPWYCPETEAEGECGVLIESCQDCSCFSNDYECQENGTCLFTGGEGEGEGEPTHSECIEVTEGAYSCVEFPGSGLDQCQIDADCYDTYHTVCNEDPSGNYCQTALGPGRNQCDLEGCLPDYLNRCDDYTWDNECRIASEPLFCSESTFVNDCNTCGCPSGLDCQSDGSCSYDNNGGDNFDDLIYISTISVGLDKNIYVKDLIESKLKSTLEFEKSEVPIMRFIRPAIIKMSLDLPEKPEIEKVEEGNFDEIVRSPPKDIEKIIVIQGLKKKLEGIQLSPGVKNLKEFEMIIGRIDNNPYIGLSFPDLP